LQKIGTFLLHDCPAIFSRRRLSFPSFFLFLSRFPPAHSPLFKRLLFFSHFLHWMQVNPPTLDCSYLLCGFLLSERCAFPPSKRDDRVSCRVLSFSSSKNPLFEPCPVTFSSQSGLMVSILLCRQVPPNDFSPFSPSLGFSNGFSPFPAISWCVRLLIGNVLHGSGGGTVMKLLFYRLPPKFGAFLPFVCKLSEVLFFPFCLRFFPPKLVAL